MFYNTDNLNDGEIYLKLYKTADGDITKGYVPAYYFKIIRTSDDTVLGICDLRIGHNDNTYYGGNIGYEVYEEYRGKHYAGKACLLLFELSSMHNMDYVVITCNPDNYASQKTCEYAGATLKQIVDVPEWHDMYKDGKRRTCIYIKNIS